MAITKIFSPARISCRTLGIARIRDTRACCFRFDRRQARTTANHDTQRPRDRDYASFRCSSQLVFQALTTPELVKRWLLGPTGWSMPICEIDLRVGGAYRYVWKGEGGKSMEMQGVFREIQPPGRCVQTEKFSPSWYPGDA